VHAEKVSRYIFPVRRLVLVCVLSTVAWAADYKDAKVVELRDATQVGAATVYSTSPSGPPSTDVPAIAYRCYLTVELDREQYSAIFPVNNHLKISDFNSGDIIPARISGNKLLIRTLDGKEMKSKIVEHKSSK